MGPAYADVGAAFLFSITSLMAAAPALAVSDTLQTVKVPAVTTPSVPPAAVDSAVNQIISAVKVVQKFVMHAGHVA